MQKLNLRKFFLYLLIGSVSISAVLGIAVVILGNYGELEGKIIGTTFIITCTSILGLACGANIEAKRGKLLPYGGIIFAIISSALWIILVWAGDFNGETYLKMSGSTTLLAVAFSHLSLITLARLDKKFQWSMILLFISAIGLVLILLGIIWSNGSGSEFIERAVAVLSIGVASLTVMVPIFHKLSDNLDSRLAIDNEIEKLQARLAELKERRENISKNI